MPRNLIKGMEIRSFCARGISLLTRKLLCSLGVDAVTGLRFSPFRRRLVLGSARGAWVIPAHGIRRGAICYCAGCGEDISFDLSLITRFGAQVWAFDPTPRSIRHVHQVACHISQYHFSPIGLWSSEKVLEFFAPQDPAHVSHSVVNLQNTSHSFSAPVSRLSRIMASEGHSRIALLKLDIEGAEYEVLRTIVEDRIPIGVLCVEFDEYFHPIDPDYRARIRQSLESLFALGMVLFDARGNGNYTLVQPAVLARDVAV